MSCRTILSLKGRWQDTNRSVLKADIEGVWDEFFRSFGGRKSVSAPKTYKQRKCKTDGCNRQLRLKPSNPTCERFIIQVHSDASLNVHNHPELNPEENATMADDGSLAGTRGLPQNVKSLIEEVIKTDYLHYVTVNGMFEHLNNHHSTRLSPLTDMRNGAEIKKRFGTT
jgi:hypothetical protein